MNKLELRNEAYLIMSNFKHTVFLLTGLMQLLAVSAYAYDVKIDGVYYNLNANDKTASVTYYSYNNN